MKALHSRYRIVWTAAVLAVSPLLAGADGEGCHAGGKINVGSGNSAVDAGGSTGEAGSSCTQADCAGLGILGDAKLCSDGTTLGRSVCARSPYTGACEWDFPACPPVDASAACMCAGPAPGAPNGMCPDGSISGPVCVVNPVPPVPGMPAPPVSCSWTFRSCATDAAPCPQYGCFPQCPNGVLKDQKGCDTCVCAPGADSGSGGGDGSVGAACTKADCAGLAAPALAKVCPDGSTVALSLCALSPDTMKCDWTFPECPKVDAAAACVCAGPAPGVRNGVCPDGSISGPVCVADPKPPIPGSAPGPLTCSWTLRSCPVDAGSCAAIAQTAVTTVQSVLQVASNTTCTIDADCEVVPYASNCFDECSRGVNAAGAAALQSAIATVNATVCPAFQSAGCRVALPPCQFPGGPSCVAGHCQ